MPENDFWCSSSILPPLSPLPMSRGQEVTVWPLNDRQAPGTTPELQYLYADWGSKVPYRGAATALQELLPGRVSNATLRRPTLKVGARLQQRVIEPSEYDWPESRREPVPAAKSLSVAIDGTYVASGWKELVAGIPGCGRPDGAPGPVGRLFCLGTPAPLRHRGGFHEGGAGSQRLDTGVASEGAGGRSRWIWQSCGCCGRAALGWMTCSVSGTRISENSELHHCQSCEYPQV